jgi:hypothetical protein
MKFTFKPKFSVSTSEISNLPEDEVEKEEIKEEIKEEEVHFELQEVQPQNLGNEQSEQSFDEQNSEAQGEGSSSEGSFEEGEEGEEGEGSSEDSGDSEDGESSSSSESEEGGDSEDSDSSESEEASDEAGSDMDEPSELPNGEAEEQNNESSDSDSSAEEEVSENSEEESDEVQDEQEQDLPQEQEEEAVEEQEPEAEPIKPDWVDDAKFKLSLGESVFLWGGAGAGKSFGASLIAKQLQVPFGYYAFSEGFIESQLYGSLLPVGSGGSFEFIPSLFMEMSQEEGVFLFDEVFKADPSVLTSLNNFLAQGYIYLPQRSLETLRGWELDDILEKNEVESLSELRKKIGNKEYSKLNREVAMIKKHKNFKIIMADNTLGKGNDKKYITSNKQDAAFLDRISPIEVKYSAKIEAELCAPKLITWASQVREVLKETRLEEKYFLSTRYLLKAQKRIDAGLKLGEAVEDFVARFSKDEEDRFFEKLMDIVSKEIEARKSSFKL